MGTNPNFFGAVCKIFFFLVFLKCAIAAGKTIKLRGRPKAQEHQTPKYLLQWKSKTFFSVGLFYKFKGTIGANYFNTDKRTRKSPRVHELNSSKTNGSFPPSVLFFPPFFSLSHLSSLQQIFSFMFLRWKSGKLGCGGGNDLRYGKSFPGFS